MLTMVVAVTGVARASVVAGGGAAVVVVVVAGTGEGAVTAGAAEAGAVLPAPANVVEAGVETGAGVPSAAGAGALLAVSAGDGAALEGDAVLSPVSGVWASLTSAPSGVTFRLLCILSESRSASGLGPLSK